MNIEKKFNLIINAAGCKRPIYKSYLWGAYEKFRCEDEL